MRKKIKHIFHSQTIHELDNVFVIFSDKFEEFLLSFSLFTTVPLVTTTKQGKNAIECLNGIRVLAFFAVVFGHTYVMGTVYEVPSVIGKVLNNRKKKHKNCVISFIIMLPGVL